MTRKTLTLLLFLTSSWAAGQRLVSRSVGGVGSGGLTSESLITPTEAANPAAMTEIKVLTISAGGNIPYALTELTEMTATAAIPTQAMTAAVRVSRSGGTDSHFTTFGAEASRTFGRMAIGMGYHGFIHTLPFGERGRSSYSTVGIACRPSEGWQIGLSVRNIERRRLRYAAREIDLPTTIWGSIRWQAYKYFALCAEVEKEVSEDAIGRLGISIRPTGGLFFTAGFSSLGTEMSMGAGYDWGIWGVRASVSHDAQLGITSGAAVTFHPRWP